MFVEAELYPSVSPSHSLPPPNPPSLTHQSDEDSVFGKDDSSDDDSFEEQKLDDGRPELKGRARWLKKTDQPDARKTQAAQQAANAATGGGAEKKATDASKPLAASVVKRQIEVITEEILDKKISDYMATRGRKQADPRELLRQLEVLAKSARKFGPRKEIPVIMHLISAMYESHPGIDDYMDLYEWRNCFRYLMRITTLLNANHDIVLGLIASEDVTDLVLASQINTDLMKKKDAVEPVEVVEEKPKEKSPILSVVGSLESFVSRLEDEYTKSLQQINPHTQVRIYILHTFTVHHPLASSSDAHHGALLYLNLGLGGTAHFPRLGEPRRVIASK